MFHKQSNTTQNTSYFIKYTKSLSESQNYTHSLEMHAQRFSNMSVTSRVTYFILQVHAETSASHSEHRKSSEEV